MMECGLNFLVNQPGFLIRILLEISRSSTLCSWKYFFRSACGSVEIATPESGEDLVVEDSFVVISDSRLVPVHCSTLTFTAEGKKRIGAAYGAAPY
jgi:hypothetical protein